MTACSLITERRSRRKSLARNEQERQNSMIARIQNVDILDLPADALIYSTNVLLNCSGGIGACLVERYGQQVQDDLHGILRERGTRFVERGSIFQLVTQGMPYKMLFHTVPSNGFYETTEGIITDILRQCLEACLQSGQVKTIAVSALATGYGRLPFDEFFRIAASVFSEHRFAPIDSVTICIQDGYLFRVTSEQIFEESLPLMLV